MSFSPNLTMITLTAPNSDRCAVNIFQIESLYESKEEKVTYIGFKSSDQMRVNEPIEIIFEKIRKAV